MSEHEDGIDVKLGSWSSKRARCPLCGENRPCSTVTTAAGPIVVIGCPCVPAGPPRVIGAAELLPPGATLPDGVCRTCGGCGEMTTCDRWDPRPTKPCGACRGTGKRT